MGFRFKVAELEPTKVPTAVDIAWAAGIYEGEGCCQASKIGRFTIRVTQKDPEILYRLREWLGGSVVKQGICHAWLACGDRGRYFTALIYSFLSARRKSQIDMACGLSFLHGADPSTLSIPEISDLLDSRPTRSRRSDALGPEERKRRRILAVQKYQAKEENQEKIKTWNATTRKNRKLRDASVTVADTVSERVN